MLLCQEWAEKWKRPEEKSGVPKEEEEENKDKGVATSDISPTDMSLSSFIFFCQCMFAVGSCSYHLPDELHTGVPSL